MDVIRKLDDGTELLRYDMGVEVKAFEDSEGKKLSDHEIEMIGTTSNEDRHGESISIEAWDLKAYKKNPVILAQHDYTKPPIGKAVEISVKGEKMVFKIQFPEEGINPEADIYRKMYKSGFMNASSVGFIPKKWVDGDGKSSPIRKYTKAELLELSLVSVPANSEAIVVGRSLVEKGILSESEAKSVGFAVSDDPVVKGDDPMAMITGEMDMKVEECMKRMDALEARVLFIEGFISGLGKSSVVEETRSFIKELLVPKRTEKQSLKDEVSKLIKGS